MTPRRLALALGTAAALGLALPAAAQTTLLFNSFIPMQHPANTRVLKPWVEDIAKATEGRVKIDMPPTSLAAPAQQMDGVKKGVFDIAYQFHGVLPQAKVGQISELPGVNTTARGSSVALWRTYDKFFRNAPEYKDVQVLGLWVGMPGTTFSMKGPIDSVAQYKGMKVYGLPGAAAELLGAAGAGVVAVPAVRSHEIISGGTVDAFAGYSLMDANAFKTLQYAKHVLDIPGHLTAPSFVLFMNKAKWQALSQADRDAITRLSGESFAQRFAAYDEIEAKLRADAAGQGISIKAASPAYVSELMKLAAPLEQAWINDAKSVGVDGAAALAFYKQQAQANAR